MALYNYKAYAKDGSLTKGSLDASSVDMVRQQLIKQGMYPYTIALAKDQAAAVPFYRRIFQRPITLKDKILFTKQLAVLLRSGVPLLQAIELLTQQFSGRMRTILIQIKDDIKEGRSFYQGLARYPKVFDNIYIQLVRAGEASGQLEPILDRLDEYMERRADIQKRIKGALSYPMIQLSIVVVVVVGLLTFVVPKLTEAFEAQGMDLPGTTKFLMNMSAAIRSYWWLLLIIIAVIIGLFKFWVSRPAGARTFDKIKLKIPIVGYFTRMGSIVQFCRTLGLLIESGVNLSESLDIVVQITNNRILKDTLSQARDKIIKQGKIAEYLRQTGIFPPIATYLIKTGEESGQLDAMLLTVAKNYEADVRDYADGLASKLEPIMLVVMGGIVGFIVLSVMQPMLKQAEFVG